MLLKPPKLKPETLEIVAHLTEKYHLDDTDNGMTFSLNGIKVKTIDFTLVHYNRDVMKLYEVRRFEIDMILHTITAASESVPDEAHNDPEFQMWIRAGIDKAAEIMEDIMTNLFEEGFREIENLTELMNIKGINDMVEFILDMIKVIDISLYCGFKRLYEHRHDMGQYLFDKGFLKVPPDTPDAEDVVKKTIEFINEKYLKIMQRYEDEAEPNYDLSKMSTIGNA